MSPSMAAADECNLRSDYTCIVVWLWRKVAGGGKKKEPGFAIPPPGHLAVTVGASGRRVVIKASSLNHPVFRGLLEGAYEECGYNHHCPLVIPCNELVFAGIVLSLKDCKNGSHCCL